MATKQNTELSAAIEGNADQEEMNRHIAALERKLNDLTLEGQAVQEQLADIWADRQLGKKVSMDTLADLEEQAREVSVETPLVRMQLIKITERRDAIKASENERLATIHLAEVGKLTVETLKTQSVVVKALEALIDAYEPHFENVKRLQDEYGEVRKYDQVTPFNAEGLRCDLFVIPKEYMQHGKLANYDGSVRHQFGRWMDEPRRRQAERERQHAEHVRMSEEAKELEERFKRFQEAPSWGRGDADIALFDKPAGNVA